MRKDIDYISKLIKFTKDEKNTKEASKIFLLLYLILRILEVCVIIILILIFPYLFVYINNIVCNFIPDTSNHMSDEQYSYLVITLIGCFTTALLGYAAYKLSKTAEKRNFTEQIIKINDTAKKLLKFIEINNGVVFDIHKSQGCLLKKLGYDLDYEKNLQLLLLYNLITKEEYEYMHKYFKLIEMLNVEIASHDDIGNQKLVQKYFETYLKEAEFSHQMEYQKEMEEILKKLKKIVRTRGDMGNA